MRFDSKQLIFFLSLDWPWTNLQEPEHLPQKFKGLGQLPPFSSQLHPRHLTLHFAQEFGCNPKTLMALFGIQAFHQDPRLLETFTKDHF